MVYNSTTSGELPTHAERRSKTCLLVSSIWDSSFKSLHCHFSSPDYTVLFNFSLFYTIKIVFMCLFRLPCVSLYLVLMTFYDDVKHFKSPCYQKRLLYLKLLFSAF